MQDPRALNNPTNLRSWRAWRQKAYLRSGFMMITTVASPLLTIGFVFACTLYRPALLSAGASVVLALGLYLAIVLGLMVFAMLRLKAWERAHPWTPPN